MEVLIAAAWAAERWIERKLQKRYGLTYPQYEALAAMARAGAKVELSLGQIAAEVKCSRGNLTGIIDRLEATGWIRRRRSEKDRRVVHVCPTDPQRLAELLSFVEQHRTLLPPELAEYLTGFVQGLEVEAHAQSHSL